MLAKRLSPFFAVILILGACGKDASIQLTRPEPEVIKTKKVHFNLETDGETTVASEFEFANNVERLDKPGLRSYDVPIGSDIKINIKLEPGWRVSNWIVLPGANLDYDRGAPTIKISNLQEEIRITAHVEKIPPPKIETKRVHFSLDAPGEEADDSVTAEVTFADQKKRLEAAGKLSFDVPIGADIKFRISIPENWELDTWDVLPGGNFNPEKGSPVLVYKELKDDITVIPKLRKKKELRIPRKNVVLVMETRDNGTIEAKVSALELPLIFDGPAQKTFELPEGKDFSVDLKLPQGWELEKWQSTPGADMKYAPGGLHVDVTNLHDHIVLKALVRRAPELRFLVRLAGPDDNLSGGVPGSGVANWMVFEKEAYVHRDFALSALSPNWCATSSRSVDLDHSDCRIFRYKNDGYNLVLRVKWKDKEGNTWSHTWELTLKEHTIIDVDLFKVIGKDPKKVDFSDYITTRSADPLLLKNPPPFYEKKE